MHHNYRVTFEPRRSFRGFSATRTLQRKNGEGAVSDKQASPDVKQNPPLSPGVDQVDPGAQTFRVGAVPVQATETTLDAVRTENGLLDSNGHRRAASRSATDFRDVFGPPVEAGDLGTLSHYRILELIGHGGMGYVFRALDTQLGRTVAIKIIRRQSENATERFLREARALAAVTSDHVVTIFQVGQVGTVSFLVMEFLEGRPLSQLLDNQKGLTLPQILRLGREAAEGLAATHERGLVHRDIKPDNLWITAKGMRLKILDFGVAHDMEGSERLTQEGSVLGTPMYMAPEQAEGGTVDARCDLFALGCVLYLLCTGENAFCGKSAFEILTRIAIDVPPSPREANPRIPLELSDLVEELLSKDPADRPVSAAAVAARLGELESEYGDTLAVATPRKSDSVQRKLRRQTAAEAKPASSSSSRWHMLYVTLLTLGIGLLAVIAFRPPPPERAAHHGPPTDHAGAESLPPPHDPLGLGPGHEPPHDPLGLGPNRRPPHDPLGLGPGHPPPHDPLGLGPGHPPPHDPLGLGPGQPYPHEQRTNRRRPKERSASSSAELADQPAARP